MREFTIKVGKHDTDGRLTLRRLERHLFPGELVEVTETDSFVFTVIGDRADYLMDLLRIATDDPAFDSFSEWKARNEDQGELSLDSFAENDPIHATAG